MNLSGVASTKEKSVANREIVLSILGKLGVEFTSEISEARATAKMERALAKFNKLLPPWIEWTDEEMGLLTPMGVKVEERKTEDEMKKDETTEDEGAEDEAEEETEADEKPAKKSKKKGKKAKAEKPSKKKKGKKAPKEKREGNVELMTRLHGEGKSEKEIEKVFLEIYKAKGQTDKDFIRGRIDTYARLAGFGKKKAKKSKKKDKGGKAKKGKKASKKAKSDEEE